MGGATQGIQPGPGHVPAQPLRGSVDWATSAGQRSVQATASDIAAGAVVSIIDAVSGVSVGATISTPAGGFDIGFGPLFQPSNNQPFYVEAIKGVQVPGTSSLGGLFNQAGADALRLRTIVIFDGATGGWHSLVPDSQGITVSNRTTTLSILIALRQQAHLPVDLPSYQGSVDPSAPTPHLPFSGDPLGYSTPNGYTPPGGGVALTDFNKAYEIVKGAIEQDRDPLQYTSLDSTSGNVATTFVGFSITSVDNPATPRKINDPITITGTGFSSGNPNVAIGGVSAPIQGSYTDDTIHVLVGPGSRTGPISVTIDGVLQAGPTITVDTSDGHECMLNGNLYVVNPTWGTLAKVDADGNVTTVVSGLGTPRQVVSHGGLLYVAAESDNEIWKIDPGNSYSQAPFAALTSAYGLAFDASGNLFASSNLGSATGVVKKFDSSGAAQATYDTFTNPHALGLDYNGKVYVVQASGAIVQIDPAGANGAPRVDWATISDARGLAIDSAGNLYVACNANGTIYKVDQVSRGVSVFSMINSPGGLAFDAKGNMYVTDLDKNLVYRITPSGNLLTLAYGISYPRGLAVDPSNGDLFVSLSHSFGILKIVPSTGVLSKFVTGIANPDTLTWNGAGMYIGQPDVNTVSFVDRSKQMSTIVTGVPWTSGADKDSNGKIYAGIYDTCLTRQDAWQPNRDPVYSARFGIVDTANGNAYSNRYPILTAGTTTFLAAESAVAGVQHVYAINQGSKTLTMVTTNANGSQTTQLIYTFASTPQEVNYDSAGNIYVAVPSENKVYRFLKASSYAQDSIGGFSTPISITFDGMGAMWVSNQTGDTLRKVTTPASDLTTSFTSVAVPAGIATNSLNFRGCSWMSGTNYIFVACGQRIARYDTGANSFIDYTGYDLPENVSQIWARSTGVLYCKGYGAWNAYTINADTSNTAWQMTAYGGAFTYDPGWGAWQTGSYGPQIYGNPSIGTLGLTHEVGVDAGRNYLYIAGGAAGANLGGLFRFELGTNPKEMYVAGTSGVSYSLAINTTNGDVYVGQSNGHIHLVDLNGAATDKWTIPGTPTPYGLDIYANNQLWVVGSDSKIYDIPVGGAVSAAHLYGIMQPSF